MKLYSENMREVFGKTLVELGEKYKELIVLDADLFTSTMTIYFKQKFPQRFIQCGVSEGNMFGIAGGLAKLGFITIPTTFASFAVRKCLDQIFMNICYPKLNVKIPGLYAGITASKNGPSHNLVEDIAIMRSLPFIRVVIPGDNRELKSFMFKMMEYEGPVYFRVPRVEPIIIFNDDFKFEWGKGNLIKSGKDISLLSTGFMTGIALKASEYLEKEGINAEIIHISSIKPIDEEIIVKTAKKTGFIFTLEDGRIYGGFGSAVSEVITKYYPINTYHFGIEDNIVESASIREILYFHKLTPKYISQRIIQILKEVKKGSLKFS